MFFSLSGLGMLLLAVSLVLCLIGAPLVLVLIVALVAFAVMSRWFPPAIWTRKSAYRFVALGALGLSLGSCAEISKLSSAFSVVTGATVTQKQAKLAVDTYNAAETIALDYLARPLCQSGQTVAVNACRSQSATDVINAALNKGDPAVDSLVSNIAAAHKAGANVGVAKAAYQVLMGNPETGDKGVIAGLQSATPAN